MKRNYMIGIFAALMLLSGCTRLGGNTQSAPVRMVTQVTVSYEHDPFYVTRQYTSAEKVRRVLDYLRQIKPYGKPQEDPETVGGSLIRIVLSYSDGEQQVCQQRSDRYFKKNDEAWMYVNPQKAQEISMILGEFESDPPE